MKSARYHEKPMSFMEFSEKYGTEEACREAVLQMRFPQGFVCPECGAKSHCFNQAKNVYQCNKCKRQVSLKAGTLMEKSPLPFRTWLWSIYLIATDKRGISAMELMRQIHVTYKTAWYLKHRITEAMVRTENDVLLQGVIELDDSYFGGPKSDSKSGRGTKKTKVLVAVSKDENGKPKQLRMRVVPNLKGKTVGKFAADCIAEGAKIESDALPSYRKPLAEKWLHQYEVFDPDKTMLNWLHTIVSNAKAFVLGTHHGLDEKYLQRYLDEFCYRFDRRFQQPTLFFSLLKSVLRTPPLGLVGLMG